MKTITSTSINLPARTHALIKRSLFNTKTITALMLCLSSGLVSASVLDVYCVNNTSDTDTLQNKINASMPGDQINIHGACQVNKTIVLKENRSYIGDVKTESAATTIWQANGANLAAVVASDSWNDNTTWPGGPIRIAHLHINGNKSSNSSGTVGIMMRSWLSVIEDVMISQTSSDGIRLSSPSKNGGKLSVNMVNGRISNVFIKEVNGSGIYVVDDGNRITDWDILDTWIGDTGKHGIYLDNAAGWKIRGNHLYDISHDAIFANKCWGTSIDGNYIEDFGKGGAASSRYGIACTMQSGSSASVIIGNKITMIKPLVGSTTYKYIGIPAINYAGTANVNVVDNVIVGNNAPNEMGLFYSTWCPCGGGTNLNVFSNNSVVNIAPNLNPTTYQYSKYQPYGTINYFSIGK